MWNQVYDPFANIWLSALVVAIPVIYFVLAMTIFKVNGYVAAISSVLVAVIVAITIYNMSLGKVVGSSVHGIFTGLYPVAATVVGEFLI